jgi:cold-inducible RNA-binding protein
MSKKLYIGNLSYDSTENSISEKFATIGEVTSVSLITDKFTGRSRGFAFVEMAQDADAQKAINELDGTMLDGRNIKVAEARPKRDRDSGGGGGGGRDRRPRYDRW